MQDIKKKQADNKNTLLMVITLGAMCGLIEVVGKSSLKYMGVHLSGLLIGLDCILIGVALSIYRKPAMIIGMGLIACLFKQLVVPVLGLSVMCNANACLAVMLEFGGVAVISAVLMKKMAKSTNARIQAGAVGVFMGAVVYYFAGMHVRPCQYMLSYNVAGGFISFILKEGLVWSAFSAALMPVGWSLGEKINEKTHSLIERNPRLFYLGSASAAVISLTACIISISLQGR